MTEIKDTRSSRSGRGRTRSSLETAARVAENASKKTGRPVSERTKQLLEQQRH